MIKLRPDVMSTKAKYICRTQRLPTPGRNRPSTTKKNMEIKVTKEWFASRINDEEGLEIGAGVPGVAEKPSEPGVGCAALVECLRDAEKRICEGLSHEMGIYSDGRCWQAKRVVESVVRTMISDLDQHSTTSVSGPCPPSLGSENKNKLSGG
jgi:hypothetical protein